MKKHWFTSILVCMLVVCAFTVLPNRVMGESYKSGEFSYELTEDGKAIITKYKNETYKISPGVGWTDEEGRLVEHLEIHVPEQLDGYTVAGIARDAFDDPLRREADVYIPNTVVHIEPNAFSDSIVDSYILLPDHPKYMVIGDMLYEKDTMRLMDWTGAEDYSELPGKLIIPEGTRIIGECALTYAYISEIVLPESLERIEDEAFNHAQYLRKITIPNEVTYIGEAAFHACYALEEVILPQGLEMLGCNAFHSCRTLKQIAIPGSLKEISPGAFAYCISLQQVEMPSGVEAYRNGKLLSWQQLMSITGVECIGSGAFASCTSLETIVLPDTVREVGAMAFAGCSGMKEIHLPEGLVSIGSSALSGCKSLTEITLPNSLTEVEGGAAVYSDSYRFLWNCKNLERIIVSPDHPVFREENGALIRREDCTLIAYPQAARAEEFTVPSDVLIIGRYAFSGNRYLKKITVPEGVTTIKDKAFSNCTALQELTLPLSLESSLVDRYMIGDTLRIISVVIDDCPMLQEISITTGMTGETLDENEEKVMQLMDDAGDVLLQQKRGTKNIPLVMTKESYDAYTGKMSKANRKKVSTNYKLITPEKLQKESYEKQEEYLTIFPDVVREQLYIIKYENLKESQREKLYEYFTEAGYTKADFDRDLHYINPQYLQYTISGTVEKQCVYSFADEMLHPRVYLSNTEIVVGIIDQGSSVMTDYSGLPVYREYFYE